LRAGELVSRSIFEQEMSDAVDAKAKEVSTCFNQLEINGSALVRISPARRTPSHARLIPEPKLSASNKKKRPGGARAT
jgi:hypothetical protein